MLMEKQTTAPIPKPPEIFQQVLAHWDWRANDLNCPIVIPNASVGKSASHESPELRSRRMLSTEDLCSKQALREKAG